MPTSHVSHFAHVTWTHRGWREGGSSLARIKRVCRRDKDKLGKFAAAKPSNSLLPVPHFSPFPVSRCLPFPTAPRVTFTAPCVDRRRGAERLSSSGSQPPTASKVHSFLVLWASRGVSQQEPASQPAWGTWYPVTWMKPSEALSQVSRGWFARGSYALNVVARAGFFLPPSLSFLPILHGAFTLRKWEVKVEWMEDVCVSPTSRPDAFTDFARLREECVSLSVGARFRRGTRGNTGVTGSVEIYSTCQNTSFKNYIYYLFFLKKKDSADLLI